MALTNTPYLPIKDFESANTAIMLSDSYIEEEEKMNNIKTTVPNKDSNGYTPVVDLLLEGWGLEKYKELFKLEDIGVNDLINLKQKDLLDLGIVDAEDQKTILTYLSEFHSQTISDSAPAVPNLVEDDLIMAKNVYTHLVELNSHASYIQFLMGKHKLDDYFISTHDTALKILKLVCGKAQKQSDRISDLLFDGNFKGHSNLIATILQVNRIKLPESKKEKLMQAKVRGTMKRKILLFTVAAAVGLMFTTLSIRRNLHGRFW